MKSIKNWIRIFRVRAILSLFLIGMVTAQAQQWDIKYFPDSSSAAPKGVDCDEGRPGDLVHCDCDPDGDTKACSEWLDSNCDRYDEGGWVCEVESER